MMYHKFMLESYDLESNLNKILPNPKVKDERAYLEGNVRVTLIFIFSLLVILFLILNFIVGPMLVKGSSMEPAIKDGHWVIVRHTSYFSFKNYKRNDVVLYSKGRSYPLIIGRILGIPGDTLLVENNILYVNSTPYNSDNLKPESLECLKKEKKIDSGNWFVIEDNDKSVVNSCIFAPVHTNVLKGVVLYTLPF